jgi:hypothetical protein
MKKLLVGTALLFTALPFTFDGVTPTVSKAHAIIGRPLTPFSVAGVHRRAVRRAYGVGANLGYARFYHRNFGRYAYNRFGYGYHPVARAALYDTAYGAGYYGAGYGGGYGYHPCALTLSCSPWTGGGFLDSVAVAGLYGVPWGGWGGWGWNRPFLGVGLGFAGGPPLYGGWGWGRRWW